MKKFTLCLIAFGMLFTIFPLQSNAIETTAKSELVVTKTAAALKKETLLNRLYEINRLDKSGLNAIEKKQLFSEVQYIRENLTPISGGVYISTGAIIIILLLLIILF